MASIGIQFHATRAELSALTARVVEIFNLSAAVLTHHPFCAKRVETDQLNVEVSTFEGRATSCFVLQATPFYLGAQSNRGFFDLNEGAITLELGSLTAAGLEESFTGCMSNSATKILLARKVLSVFKKETVAGATGYNSKTGASAYYKNHRISEGAMQLHRKGVRLLAIGGAVEYEPRSNVLARLN